MLENRDVMAANISKYMCENNKTRHQVCKDLGIPYSTFSEWISGRKYPRIDKIELMANYFGCEKSDLIEQKNSVTDNGNGIPKERADFINYVLKMPDEKFEKLKNLLQIVETM